MKRYWMFALGAALLVAGCGGSSAVSSSSQPTTPTPTPTPVATPVPSAAVMQGFLTASNTARANYDTWSGYLNTPGITYKGLLALAPQAATYGGQLASFDTQVSGLGATGRTATDIASLVADDQVVIGDLQALSTQTTSTVKAWGVKTLADAAAAVAADDVVRADLGLPAASA